MIPNKTVKKFVPLVPLFDESVTTYFFFILFCMRAHYLCICNYDIFHSRGVIVRHVKVSTEYYRS